MGSFFNDLGRSILNDAKREIRYDVKSGARKGVNTAINSGKKMISGEWRCSCGTTNTSKFCTNCGKSKTAKKTVCEKCGWSSNDSAPRFCPECGSKIDDSTDSDGESHIQDKDENTTKFIKNSASESNMSFTKPGDNVTLSNMTDFMEEVPAELSELATALENPPEGQDVGEYLNNVLTLAKESRNLTFGNLSVLTKALGNTFDQAGDSAASDRLDQYAGFITDLANGKYDEKSK